MSTSSYNPWRRGIKKGLRRLGFSSMMEYAKSKEAATYMQLADELGKDVAPIDVIDALTDEITNSDDLRYFAKSSLVRWMRYWLPRGWKGPISPKTGTIENLPMVSSSWASEIGMARREDVDAVCSRLKNLSDVPEAWLPSASQDPIIERLFKGIAFEFRSNLEPGERYWQLVEPVWGKISIYDGPKVFLRQFRQVRAEVGHLFASHWCVSEVRNGGLHQFFINPTGILAPEALEGFRAIGLKKVASVLAKAMRFFGEPYPREQARRRKLLAQVPGEEREEWDPFDPRDDRFYDSLNAEKGGWERAADAYAERVGAAE